MKKAGRAGPDTAGVSPRGVDDPSLTPSAPEIHGASWGEDWTVGVRVWVECAGRSMLGKGRLELLEGIERCRSISAAARAMGMSYRRAWLLVQSVNTAAGEPLVEAATGGVHGGGARLTARGRLAVAVFRELQGQLQPAAAGLLRRLVQNDANQVCVHVSAAVSLQEVLGQLLADYAFRQPQVTLRTLYGASNELVDNVLAGGTADLILTADPRQIDRLVQAGLVSAEFGPAQILARNTLAAVATANREMPIRKPADLAHRSVKRIALAEPSTPLGGYSRSYLESVELYELLRPRIVHVDNAHAVLPAVRAERADVGLVFQSDAVRMADCQVLFSVRRPPAAIEYAGAVVSRGAASAAAQSFLNFLCSAAAARRFRACGFLPIRRREAT